MKKNRFFAYLRKGSVLLVALGLLFGIALYAVGYLNYMTMQKHLRSRGEKQATMSRVARALATLAVHKLQFGPMLAQNEGGPFPETTDNSPSLFPLFRELAKPKKLMERVTGVVNLREVPTSDLYSITRDLVEPLERLGTFSFEIGFRCEPEDFQEFGLAENGFPREKRGTVHLPVTVNLNKPGYPLLTEEFGFKCRVKVCATLVPVLSKFTLYVEDAGFTGQEATYDYNRVRQDENGKVNDDSPARPLILDNDGGTLPNQPPFVENTFRDFVTNPRGLVYLGGNTRLMLNMGYSHPVRLDGPAGESFQMFRKPSSGDGFVRVIATQTASGDKLDVFQMEVGCSPSSHPEVSKFYDLIRQEAMSLFWPRLRDGYRIQESSIFRLHGVDANRSPTLVLGEVYGHILLARCYQCPRLTGPPWNSPRQRERLYLYDDPVKFMIETDTPTGRLALLREAGMIGSGANPEEMKKYLMFYSSFIASRPVNMGIAFSRNRGIPDPWKAFEGDPIYDFILGNISRIQRHGIPEPFKGAVPAATDLHELAPFLGPLKNPARYSYVISIPEGGDTDVWTALQRRGLLWRDVLTLDGLVLIRHSERKLVLDRNLTIMGNGGIHLEEGDIFIRNSIQPLAESRSKVILQLAALSGDIRLETPAGAVIQAHLIANGKTVFAGNPDTKLVGAVSMKRLCDSPAEIARFPGGKLHFHPGLAAVPSLPRDSPPMADPVSEKPVLGFSFSLVPEYED